VRKRLTLLLICILPGLANASSIGDWDSTQARGNTRDISFKTDEGTWMSVDISPDGRWIVFDLLGHIYRVPSKGGKAQSLTQDSGIALNLHPRISPDGAAIAFISDRSGQSNLWLMDADGDNARPVFLDENSRATEPAWSADGQKIFITRRMKTAFGFYRVDDAIWAYPRHGGPGVHIVGRKDDDSEIKGTPKNEREITTGNLRYQWSSPSPDGRHVYFNTSTFDGDDKHIQRIDMTDGTVETVTRSKSGFHHGLGTDISRMDQLGTIAPEVSPDGKWLAFARKLPGASITFRDKTYDGRTALWLRNLISGEDQLLMDPIEIDDMAGHPTWKLRALPGYSWDSDSSSIVISQGGKLRRVWIESGQIETIPFQARVRREISQMARSNVKFKDDYFVAKASRWHAASPDGQTLVFEAAGKLWLKSLPDGVPEALLPDSRFLERTPAWSPDGRWIAFVEADELERSHLWKIDVETRQRVQLGTEPGKFMHPSWSPDGRTIVVNSWPQMLDFEPTSPQWHLLSLSSDGGDFRTLKRGLGLIKTGFGPDGRIYYSHPSAPGQTTFSSINAAGADPVDHARFSGPMPAAQISPDGQWLAVQRTRDIYLLPLTEAIQEVNVIAGQPISLQRLTSSGGFYPHWIGSDQVGSILGDQHSIYSLTDEQANQRPLGLQVPRKGGVGTIALTHARILAMAGEGQDVIEWGTVIVQDSRIICVGDCDTSTADRILDLSGKTIMPGLVDTHAHHQSAYDSSSDAVGMNPLQRSASATYLAFGITTTFDPSTSDAAFSINELTAAGKIIGPRSFSSGPALTCDWDSKVVIYNEGDEFRHIFTYLDALREIGRQAAQGAISIKDYKQCTRTQRQMLAEAAREVGVSITTENGDLFYILGQVMNGHTGWEHPMQYRPLYGDVSAFFGAAGAHNSSDLHFADYPSGYSMDYWYSDSDLMKDKKLLYWLPEADLAARRSFMKRPISQYSFPILAEGVWDMAQQGALPTIGSHGELHGKGAHFEVWSHATATPPLEVIRYATFNGAHFLGLDDELGTVEVGKLADIVILNSSPLDNIRNTTDIAWVMKGGQLYNADTLDKVWPDEQPYGARPWVNKDAMRRDVQPINR